MFTCRRATQKAVLLRKTPWLWVSRNRRNRSSNSRRICSVIFLGIRQCRVLLHHRYSRRYHILEFRQNVRQSLKILLKIRILLIVWWNFKNLHFFQSISCSFLHFIQWDLWKEPWASTNLSSGKPAILSNVSIFWV